MKNLYFYILFAVVAAVTACKKDDNPVLGDPDERLSATLSEYQNALVSAPGWKATLYPKTGGGYSFFIKFNTDGTVAMTSDFDETTATTEKVSAFRLKALQRPSLIFDTYSYIHLLSDPDDQAAGGARGKGYISDFEFAFTSVKNDTLKFEGTYNKAEFVLVKATQAEASTFMQSVKAVSDAFKKINTITSYFKRFTLGNELLDLNVNTTLRTITFSYFEDGVLKNFSTPYYYTADGINLVNSFNKAGLSMTSLKALAYDSGTNSLNFTVNGSAAHIQGAGRPIQVDLQAPLRFYSNPPNGTYWETYAGFTVEGVRDAFNVNGITNFDGITIWPRRQANPPYDGFLFWTTTTSFGPVIQPNYTNDGRVIFTRVGTLAFGTVPAQAAPMVNATLTQLLIPEGYYVIQTGVNHYDLVSAKDGKAWLSF